MTPVPDPREPPDPWGAFVPGARAHAAATADGPLRGLRFAVKDLIDVAGHVTGAGNPDWAAAHAAATAHAGVVQRLLGAGATLAGKTVTDELAFSLEGENAHHGTPRNPRAPGRLPGGSSSGSAVAVAAAQVDFALGTDTGGSVRIPAAFCGVFGFRPTHGRIPMDGVVPFAPSYDTLGWFAADGATLAAVGAVLLGAAAAAGNGPGRRRAAAPARALRPAWAADVAALADAGVGAALADAVRVLGARDPVAAFAGAPGDAGAAYATLQGDEIRATLGGWIAAHRPRFGAAIAARFASVEAIAPAEVDAARRWRARERRRLHALLGARGALVFPTAPCAALPLDAADADRQRFYATALAVNAIAGHAGLPQVTLPAGAIDGAPLGVSVVGPPGSDADLLALAAQWPAPPPVRAAAAR